MTDGVGREAKMGTVRAMPVRLSWTVVKFLQRLGSGQFDE